MKQKTNILIVEDSKIFAQGFQLLLEQHNLVDVIHIATNFFDTLEILKSNQIHLVFLDLNFETNKYDGFDIAIKIKQLYPAIKILVLTQHTRKSHYKRLFEECKVDAYLDKQLGVKEAFLAIDRVLEGHIYIDQGIEQMLEIENWMKISKREHEILGVIIKGLTQKEVAERLFISPKTVEGHLKNLAIKFKVKNTTELVAKYVKYKNANRENVEDSIPPFKSLE